jgi:hypothetical protein
MAYATRTCSRCGLILPQNQLHEWTEQVETSRESGTFQRFANGRTGYREGRVTYKTDHLLLCSSCYEQKELARREYEARRRLFLLAVVIAFAIVVLGIWWTVARTPATAIASTASVADSAASEAANAASAIEPSIPASSVAVIPPAADVTPIASSDSTPTVIQPISDEVGSSPPPIATAAQQIPEAAPTPDTSAPLRNAISTSLHSGQETPWADGAYRGTVSVGDIRPWRSQNCRTFGYTTNGTRSAVTIACLYPNGRWGPAQQ